MSVFCKTLNALDILNKGEKNRAQIVIVLEMVK